MPTVAQDATSGVTERRPQLSRRNSITPATAMACSSSGCRSAPTSIPRSDSCAAATSGKNYGLARFSPRSEEDQGRSGSSTGSGSSPTRERAGRLETRDRGRRVRARIPEQRSLRRRRQRRLRVTEAPFPSSPTVASPVGGYRLHNRRIGYNFGQQRPYLRQPAGRARQLLQRRAHDARLQPRAAQPHAAVLAGAELSINWVDLPRRIVHDEAVRHARHLHDDAADVRQRARPVQLGHQYRRANVRLRWEYRPGSELFVVYNEERDTLAPTFPRREIGR